jgi:hypothetical protein
VIGVVSDDRLEALLVAAEARIAEHGYDPATVLACALEGLAEGWAEDKRPLCPSCTRRRVNAAGSLCTFCVEQAELQLHHKRKWWDAHGVEAKLRQRERTRGDHAESDAE